VPQIVSVGSVYEVSRDVERPPDLEDGLLGDDDRG
jgi:hypothetical protein